MELDTVDVTESQQTSGYHRDHRPNSLLPWQLPAPLSSLCLELKLADLESLMFPTIGTNSPELSRFLLSPTCDPPKIGPDESAMPGEVPVVPNPFPRPG